MEVACLAGSFGGGAIPNLFLAASKVGTSQEPFASMAALPSSKASPVSAKSGGSGLTFSLYIRACRHWVHPSAYSALTAGDCPRDAPTSLPLAQPRLDAYLCIQQPPA